ncbi:poliovirus receptor isoform X4 [Pteropus alecto]|uniref:poliovirus receptor isoform X4 n=1 Tax=Pteropus alecto TaxID=9402 RepID=UPI00076898E7|nr:poliovirus receptor isoform X4 [Pteropus alecto]
MARAATWTWPPLLLSLLSLLSLSWAPAGAESQTVSVLAPRQVRGFLGNNATLPCKLQTQEHDVRVTLVTWMWQDPAGRSLSVAVFHPTQGPSYPSNSNFPEPGRLEFVAARPGEALRDATLVVRGLRAQDEANYTCHFATFPQGSKSAPTWLRVLAEPKNDAKALLSPLSPLSQGPVPVARCTSTEGRPPAQIYWSLDGKANNSQVPGTLPGTFTVISVLTLIPTSQVDGKNVTCTVEHESLEKPFLLPVTLTVLYPPEVSISGYDNNWYLGQSEATLNCDVRSNPEPTGYKWNTSMGLLPSSAVARGTRLLIHSMDESINTTFICSVTNTVGTGKAELTVVLREPPRDPSHQAWSYKYIIIIIIIIVVLAVAVCMCLIFRQRLQQFCQNKCRSSANDRVIYSAVNSNASSPQDLPTEGTQ